MICNNTNPCFFDMLSGKTLSCQKPDVKPDCLDSAHSGTGATITCKDNKSCAYYLSNPAHLTVKVVQIDGKVIKDDPGRNYNKCDFAFLIGNAQNKPVAILIELKGAHTNSALKQIQATLDALKNTLRKFDKVYGRVIGTQTPDMRGSEYINLKKTFQRDYRGDLKYQKPCKSPVDTVTVSDDGITL